jgi:hypothetical protein
MCIHADPPIPAEGVPVNRAPHGARFHLLGGLWVPSR